MYIYVLDCDYGNACQCTEIILKRCLMIDHTRAVDVTVSKHFDIGLI